MVDQKEGSVRMLSTQERVVLVCCVATGPYPSNGRECVVIGQCQISDWCLYA